MPFVSEAQRRKFRVMAARGEISRATVDTWEQHTPNRKDLPMHVAEKKRKKKAEFLLGFVEACRRARVPPAELPGLAKRAAAKLATGTGFLDAALALPTAALATGAVGTLLLPYAAGRMGGLAAAKAVDQLDQNRLEAYQRAAKAREYRRRAAVLQQGSAFVPPAVDPGAV